MIYNNNRKKQNLGRLIDDLKELKLKRDFNEISERTYFEMVRSKIRKINAIVDNERFY